MIQRARQAERDHDQAEQRSPATRRRIVHQASASAARASTRAALVDPRRRAARSSESRDV